jgi:cation transport ATPase
LNRAGRNRKRNRQPNLKNAKEETMFELEQAIAQWRKQMLAAGIKTPVPLEELEGHLREEIEGQIKSGLTEEEAYAAAVQKIGNAQGLRNEFWKVKDARRAQEAKNVQLGAFAGMIAVALMVGGCVIFRIGFASQQSTPAQQWSAMLAVLMMLLLSFGGWLACGLFPVIRSRRARITAIGAGAILFALWELIFFLVILPRNDFDMGQFFTIFCWAFLTPFGFMLGFAAGIEGAVRKSTAPAD